MTDSKDLRNALKDWLTIGAIVLTGVWAFWTFVWNEELKNNYEDPHLSANITLEHAATLDQTFEPAARPILVRVRVENLSKRLVRVLSGQIEIHADRLVAVNEADFVPEELAEILDMDRANSSRHWRRGKSDLIYTGSSFHWWTFAPGESHNFTRLIWVPDNLYDQLEANIYIKSTPSEDDICLKHAVDVQFQTTTLPGKKLADGSCKELPSGSSEAEAVYSELGVSTSTAYLPLPKVQVDPSPSK